MDTGVANSTLTFFLSFTFGLVLGLILNPNIGPNKPKVRTIRYRFVRTMIPRKGFTLIQGGKGGRNK